MTEKKANAGDYEGILVIQKEKGYTSFDVVAKLRGILRMKKIGHTGTLDPEATGVLPVALGKATRLVDALTDKRKTYKALLHLGITTDTQDLTGTILSRRDVNVTEEQVAEVLKSFEGEQLQVPPMYSALKVDGKRLYQLAREGKMVERKARPVTFYQIRPIKTELPLLSFEVTCSKGTYIRTLCEDIGNRLGCGGAMESLERTAAAGFTLEDSLTLAQVEDLCRENRIKERIIPVEDVLKDYPKVKAAEQADKALLNGNPIGSRLLEDPQLPSGQVRMYDSHGRFIGLFEYRREKEMFFPVKMFL